MSDPSATPPSVTALVTEFVEWVEDAAAVEHRPVLLTADLKDLRVSGALSALETRLSATTTSGSGPRQPLILRPQSQSIKDPAGLLTLASELVHHVNQNSLELPQAPSGHRLLSPSLQLLWDTAGLGLSLAGYNDTANLMAVGNVVKSFADLAKEVRRTQSGYELPLLNEGFLRGQICGMIVRIGLTSPAIVVLDRLDRLDQASETGWSALVKLAISASAPILFITPSPPAFLTVEQKTQVTLAQVDLEPLSLRESEHLHRWRGDGAGRELMWTGLLTAIKLPDPYGLEHANEFALLDEYLGDDDDRLLSDEEGSILCSDAWPVIAARLSQSGRQLAIGVYRIDRSNIPPDESRLDEIQKRIVVAAQRAADTRSGLCAATLHHFGRALATVLSRSRRTMSTAVARGVAWDLIDELWLRHRVDAVSEIVALLGLGRLYIESLGPHQRAIVELINAGQTSDTETPVQQFVSAARSLATSTASRERLLPVAELCVGLMPEVADQLPLELVEESALEVVAIFCSAGEAYRIEPILAAWEDHGFNLSRRARGRVVHLMNAEEGTYNAFARRILALTRRLELVRSTTYMSSIQLDMYRELSYMCWYIGRFAEAVDYSRAGVELSSTVLGADHPETVQTILSHGINLWNQNHREEASLLVRECWEHVRVSLPSLTSPSTLRLRRYATADFVRPDLNAAERARLREPILGEMLVRLGFNHREYIRCLHRQGVDQKMLGNPEGVTRMNEALRLARSSLGEFDHDTIEFYEEYWAWVVQGASAAQMEEFLAYRARATLELGRSHPVVERLHRLTSAE